MMCYDFLFESNKESEPPPAKQRRCTEAEILQSVYNQKVIDLFNSNKNFIPRVL